MGIWWFEWMAVGVVARSTQGGTYHEPPEDDVVAPVADALGEHGQGDAREEAGEQACVCLCVVGRLGFEALGERLWLVDQTCYYISWVLVDQSTLFVRPSTATSSTHFRHTCTTYRRARSGRSS
jgi:hypothetical protein